MRHINVGLARSIKMKISWKCRTRPRDLINLPSDAVIRMAVEQSRHIAAVLFLVVVGSDNQNTEEMSN